MNDLFGDRMKEYERIETTKFIPRLPICVRIDVLIHRKDSIINLCNMDT